MAVDHHRRHQRQPRTHRLVDQRRHIAQVRHRRGDIGVARLAQHAQQRAQVVHRLLRALPHHGRAARQARVVVRRDLEGAGVDRQQRQPVAERVVHLPRQTLTLLLPREALAEPLHLLVRDGLLVPAAGQIAPAADHQCHGDRDRHEHGRDDQHDPPRCGVALRAGHDVPEGCVLVGAATVLPDRAPYGERRQGADRHRVAPGAAPDHAAEADQRGQCVERQEDRQHACGRRDGQRPPVPPDQGDGEQRADQPDQHGVTGHRVGLGIQAPGREVSRRRRTRRDHGAE